MRDREVTVISPVGLDEDAVDLFEIDGAGLVANGFDEGTHAKVARASQEAIAGTYDESESFGGKCVVAEPGTIELVEEEGFDGIGSEAGQESGVSDPRTDFFINGEGQGLEELGLADEHQVVRTWKVLAQKSQLSQTVGRHQVGVVDDGDEHLAGTVDAEGVGDEVAFALVVMAIKLDLKGLAEDAQGVVIGVEGSVDDRGDHAFGIVSEESMFQNALARAGFAEHEAKPALLGMDDKDVENFLLVGQKRKGVEIEGMALEPEVGAKHKKLEGSERGIGFAIIGNRIEQSGFPHAFAFVVDDHDLVGAEALEANLDRAIGQMARGFEAQGFEGKSIVRADMSFLLGEEHLIVGLVGREVANAAAIKGKAVERGHPKSGVNLRIVIFFRPVGELAVEDVEGCEVQIACEELVANGAEKSFDLPFGCAVAYGRVVEQAANAGADLQDFLRGVDRAVVHVQRTGHAAFVEGGAEGFDERVHVLGRKELTVTADAAGIVDKGNETRLNGRAVDAHVRAVKRVGLPHFVGIGFCKGETDLVRAIRIGFEKFVLVDEPTESVGGDLPAGERARLNAEAVKQGERGRFAMDLWAHCLDGREHILQNDLAYFAFVGTGLAFHDRDPVLFVTGIPGLDRAPGKLAGDAVFVGERHFAHGFNARGDTVAEGHVDGAEDAHLQIGCGIFHKKVFASVGTLPTERKSEGLSSRVVAGVPLWRRNSLRAQFGSKRGRAGGSKGPKSLSGATHPRNET